MKKIINYMILALAILIVASLIGKSISNHSDIQARFTPGYHDLFGHRDCSEYKHCNDKYHYFHLIVSHINCRENDNCQEDIHFTH